MAGTLGWVRRVHHEPFNVFQISSSATTAQSMRLNAVVSNLANADSCVVSSDGKPYRAKQVV